MSVFFDASAMVAIVTGEPERELMMTCALQAGPCFTSPLALFEAELAVTRKLDGDRDEADSRLAELKRSFGIETVVIEQVTGDLAREAWRRYGRGSNHPAKLNLGDCFTYAVARQRDLALLFKGEDFIHTDVVPALPRL